VAKNKNWGKSLDPFQNKNGSQRVGTTANCKKGISVTHTLE